MHDVRCSLRRLANLDHIVVGRAGVFAIDTRHWMGRLEVKLGGADPGGSSREATLECVAESALALSDVVPGLEHRIVVPVLCFNRDEPVSGWARDVLVCTTGNVVDLLTTQKRVLASDQVDQVFDLIRECLPTSTYRVGEPRARPRNLHRLEGRARTRWTWWKGSSAKHLA